MGVMKQLYIELCNLPKLYKTDGDKDAKFLIKFILPLDNDRTFEWWLKEFDEKTGRAFGYANLNDPEMSELGYIGVQELLENGAFIDPEYKPLTLAEIKNNL